MRASLIIVLGALAAVACSSHDVRLAFPDAAGHSDEFTCSGTTGAENCVSGGQHDPAADNRMGTVTVIMPRECQQHFHEIVIHDAGSSKPSAHVVCAPLENKIALPQ
jgi:hypothetical protein